MPWAGENERKRDALSGTVLLDSHDFSRSPVTKYSNGHSRECYFHLLSRPPNFERARLHPCMTTRSTQIDNDNNDSFKSHCPPATISITTYRSNSNQTIVATQQPHRTKDHWIESWHRTESKNIGSNAIHGESSRIIPFSRSESAAYV